MNKKLFAEPGDTNQKAEVRQVQGLQNLQQVEEKTEK